MTDHFETLSLHLFNKTSKIFALKGQHPSISYLLIQSQEKLILKPARINGLPLKLNHYLLNQLKLSVFPKFQASPFASGFKVVTEYSSIFFLKQVCHIEGCSFSPQKEFFKDPIVKQQTFEEIERLVIRLENMSKNNKYFVSQRKQNSVYICEYLSRTKILQGFQEKEKGRKQITSRRLYEETQSTQQNLQKTNNKKIFHIKDIVIDESQRSRKIIGGVSTIQQLKISSLIYLNPLSGQETTKNPQKLAQKLSTAHKPSIQQQKQKNLSFRFNQELKIIDHLQKSKTNKNYLLNYYIEKSHELSSLPLAFGYLMDYMDMNLTEFLLTHRNDLTMINILDLCLEVVRIVLDIHSSGVVHRDIKPDNIMVQTKGDKISLKLIDFSDSSFLENSQDPIDIQMVHGTFPYSPIETNGNFPDYFKKGINKKQIDYWSVGVLIHIIFYGYMPISSSCCFWREIKALWKEQFLTCYRSKPQHKIFFLDQIFQNVCARLLQTKQEKRMNLAKVYHILKESRKFYSNMLCTEFQLEQSPSKVSSSLHKSYFNE